MNVKSTEEITLHALKREHARLSKKADNAKAIADECMNRGSEWIAIQKEVVKIINAKDYTKQAIDKLDDLKKREERVHELGRMDFIKLLDAESDTAFERDQVAQEIQNIEFRLKILNR